MDNQPVEEQAPGEQPKELEIVAPNGKWLAEGGGGRLLYVVNPDHIARLLSEGYKEIEDPRGLAEGEAYVIIEPEPEAVTPVALVALPDTALPPGVYLDGTHPAQAGEQLYMINPDSGEQAGASGLQPITDPTEQTVVPETATDAEPETANPPDTTDEQKPEEPA